MFDIVIESTGSILVATSFFILIRSIKCSDLSIQPGIRFITAGLTLLLIILVVEISNEFHGVEVIPSGNDRHIHMLQLLFFLMISILLLALGVKKLMPHLQDLISRYKTIEQKNSALNQQLEQAQQACRRLEFELAQRSEESRQSQIAYQQTQGKLLKVAPLVTIGQLFSSLAHELNQPLGVIQGRADLAKFMLQREQDLDRGKLQHNLYEISASVVHVSKLIKHIRTFSKQNQPLDLQPIDINWLVEETFVLLSESLHIHSVNVSIDIGEDLPILVCDNVQVQQLLTNLIINAQQAVKDKADKTVCVRTYQEGGMICIDIEDNGIGIDRSINNKVFEPFFTTKETNNSVGLGLTVGQEIVKRHRGELIFNSKKGEYTCFTIRLPFSQSC